MGATKNILGTFKNSKLRHTLKNEVVQECKKTPFTECLYISWFHSLIAKSCQHCFSGSDLCSPWLPSSHIWPIWLFLVYFAWYLSIWFWHSTCCSLGLDYDLVSTSLTLIASQLVLVLGCLYNSHYCFLLCQEQLLPTSPTAQDSNACCCSVLEYTCIFRPSHTARGSMHLLGV